MRLICGSHTLDFGYDPAACARIYIQAAALRAAVYGHTPQQTKRTKNNGKSERGGRGVRAEPLANRPAYTAAQLSDFYALSFLVLRFLLLFVFTRFRLDLQCRLVARVQR